MLFESREAELVRSHSKPVEECAMGTKKAIEINIAKLVTNKRHVNSTLKKEAILYR